MSLQLELHGKMNLGASEPIILGKLAAQNFSGGILPQVA